MSPRRPCFITLVQPFCCCFKAEENLCQHRPKPDIHQMVKSRKMGNGAQGKALYFLCKQMWTHDLLSAFPCGHLSLREFPGSLGCGLPEQLRIHPSKDTGSIPALGRVLEKGMAIHFYILALEFYGQRSLPVGYTPWGHKESDVIVVTSYRIWKDNTDT